jgi:hypothetical protein
MRAVRSTKKATVHGCGRGFIQPSSSRRVAPIFPFVLSVARNQDKRRFEPIVVSRPYLPSGERAQQRERLADLFQAQLAIILLGNPVALTGGVFKFLAVHDFHCATGVFDELLLLQNTSCQAHAWPICP